MEFTIETVYDQKAMTAMVRGIRKVLRKKQSRRTKVFGAISAALGVILLFSAETFDFRSLITLGAVSLIVFAVFFQDSINGYFARKRGLPGLDTAVVTFRENGYHSSTAIGESDFPYGSIQCVIDAGAYFVFAFSPSHGQVYDKNRLTGGTVEEFKDFIIQKTGKQIETA